MKTKNNSMYSIVIRKRSGFETADLTLRILRNQWKSIFIFYFPLMIPFNILNYLFCWPLLNRQTILFEDFLGWNGENSLFMLVMISLIFVLELNFVGGLLINYLGRWLFDRNNVSYRDILGEWIRSVPQLLFYNLLFSIFYVRYEFLPEIILLEKTPFFKNRDNNNITSSKRAKVLHKGRIGDKFQQIILSYFYILILVVGLGVVHYWGMSVIANEDLWKNLYIFIVLPLFFWGIALFIVVNNFLNYINLRITQEGWDLDVLFKNECFRLDHENDLFLYRSESSSQKYFNDLDSVKGEQDAYSSAKDIAIRSLVLDFNQTVKSSDNQKMPSDIQKMDSVPMLKDDVFAENEREMTVTELQSEDE